MMTKLKSDIIEKSSKFFGKMEMVKLEKNIHKTWNFLTIFKKEGATIIATTSLYHLLKSNYIATM